MDDEVGLPRATINKMIRDSMPSDSRLSADCCDKLIECATEFVNLLSSEANEVCSAQEKSTIHPDHVVKALEQLQFGFLLPGVQETYSKFKAEHKHGEKRAFKKSGADKVGMSEEEQIALQQQMFAAARARSMGSADFSSFVPPRPPAPAPP
eukprot:jgi/Tetstr1/465692/TSEL_010333.t1